MWRVSERGCTGAVRTNPKFLQSALFSKIWSAYRLTQKYYLLRPTFHNKLSITKFWSFWAEVAFSVNSEKIWKKPKIQQKIELENKSCCLFLFVPGLLTIAFLKEVFCRSYECNVYH